jgi:transglutaminase-like putative cysteine protease
MQLVKKFRISRGHETPPDRHAFYALLMAFAIAVSPHLGRLPAWFAILALAVFAWSYRIVAGKIHHPGSLVRISILLIVMFILYRHYGTLLGRDAGVAMLVSLTLLKFLELKSQRDYMLVVFLSMFIVITAFLYSQAILLGIYLFAVVGILLSVLMYLNHRSRLDIRSMLKNAVKLMLAGVPIAALLFLLFPRLQSGLFTLPGDSHAGLSGMSDTLKPGSINELNLSQKVAFRVEFTGQVPPPEQLYWRGLVLERYERGTWKQSNAARSETELRYDPENVIEYSILQEPSNQKWVFALDMPVDKPNTVQWNKGRTLRSNSLLRERRQVKLKSAVAYTVAEITDADYMLNLDTSAVTGNRIAELAASLYRQSNNNNDAYVRAVYDYFRENGFAYTLRPPELGDNPVESFMLDTRSGYCEHYASSFAVMMRLAGIPARVVIGYQGGEWNDQGDYMIVRQSDAHAWSEVWLEKTGWTRIDPTSAVAPERIEFGLEAIRQLVEQGEALGQLNDERLRTIFRQSSVTRAMRGMAMFWDDVNTRWYKWIIGYGSDNQQSLLMLLGLNNSNLYNLIIVLVIMVSCVFAIQLWMLYRREFIADPVRKQYQHYCKKLSRIGLPRKQHEGPLTYAKRVIEARPDLERQVKQVTGLYIGIMYAGKQSGDMLKQLKSQVRKFWPRPLKT